MSSEGPHASSLAITLLGTFRVAVDGAPVPDDLWTRRKAQALVRLLACTPGHRMHREQLVEMLWPESTPEEGMRALHKALHFARRALEPDLGPRMESRFLATRDQLIELGASGGVWVDADEFERLADAALRDQDLTLADQALELYEGDLLPGDIYEPWASGRRERLALLRSRLLVVTARLHLTNGDRERARERLETLLAAEPANEDAHRSLMRLHAECGDRHLALRQYDVCREVLARELDVEPEPATEALRGEILSGQLAPAPEPSVECEAEARAIEPPVVRIEPAALPVRRRWETARRAAIVASAIAVLASAASSVTLTDQGRYYSSRWRAGLASAVDELTGRTPRLVTLTGRIAGPVGRVELLDSVSGWAALVGADGEFVLRDAAWVPGRRYEFLLTTPNGAEVVVSYDAPDAEPAGGRLDLGHLVFSRGRAVEGTDRMRLRSTSYRPFDAENLAYYLGVFDAVTSGKSSDAEIVAALNAYVASKYVATGYPVAGVGPRRTLELGSGLSGNLTLAMATLARAGGFDVRLVEVTDAGESGVTHMLVEVFYDGGWHLYDPAYGIHFQRPDGSVASFQALRRDPSLADTAMLDRVARFGWSTEAVKQLYTTGIHHHIRFREPELDPGAEPYRPKRWDAVSKRLLERDDARTERS